ncbi:ribosome export protein [Scheffersomyces coipomensis]|uniref:ribosome export protein n=1 Tax=Scheffersomyces coipomensis TaxID=1788519 RepID=UPI00315D774C
MSLPFNVILKELESSPSSIIPILSTLHYDKSVLNDISKPDIKHLVSRTLNLARSPNLYNKWAGTSLIRVLGDNFTILSQEGVNFFSQLMKNLESYNETIDIKILNTTVDTLNHLCDNIRGKPTLTREILTPRLAPIITLYMEKLHYNPYLLIKSLHKLIKLHPTTFRPFGNKLRARLLEFLNLNDFITFPDKLKKIIFKTLASLPIIEKTEPEVKWENDVKHIVSELRSVMVVYGEFLNLNDDSQLKKLVEKIASTGSDDKLLTDLSIDVNDPKSIFQISARVELLLGLLEAYLSTKTSYGVRVPLGLVLIAIEIVCSINVRFTSFRNDIRDNNIKNIVTSTILLNHLNAIKTLKHITLVYRGSLLPHFLNIVAFLETLIPFKNKKIDVDHILNNEMVYRELISSLTSLLSLISNLGDSSTLLRFIDVALILVEPRVLDQEATANKKVNQNNGGSKKQRKKNNSQSTPLSDILSHQHLFSQSIPSLTIKIVRQFFNSVIPIVSLPPTQHYKLMRYLIIETVNAKYYNNENIIPEDLVVLLRNAVLFPGYEKVSLLPIISSLLSNDPLISVFINPRFPPLPIFIKKVEVEETNDMELDSEDDDEDDENESEFQLATASIIENLEREEITPQVKSREHIEEESVPKRQKVESVPGNHVTFTMTQSESRITETISNSTTDSSSVAPISATTSSSLLKQDVEDESDSSDFEIPQIQLEESDYESS